MDNTAIAELAPPPEARERTMSAPTSPPDADTNRWQAWDNFLERTGETGFMQSSWWADFRATVGFDHFAAILRNRGDMIGGALVQKLGYTSQNCFYYLQDGPVLPDNESDAAEVFAALLESLEERRQTEQQTVSHLRIEPRWQRLPPFVRGFRSVPEFTDKYSEPRNTLCIELRASEEAILTLMKPKGRYNVRVAQRHGVSIVEDNSARGCADFVRIYEAMSAHQGIGAKPASYFENLLSALWWSQKGSIYFAEYQGERLATALVVYFGRRATYFFGGSLNQQRQTMAPYLLHFEIMRRAKALGHEWYDLWGVAPEDALDHPWQDISVFKRKFGGMEVKLVPTLDYVYDVAAYVRYVANECGVGESLPQTA